MLSKIRKMLKHQEGFTLVELMIVVVILGILAGIGIQQYGRVQQNAKIAAHNANIKVITSAANMYLMTKQSVDTDEFNIDTLVDEGYLDGVPENPFGDGDAKYQGDYDVTLPEEGPTRDEYGTWEIIVVPDPYTES